MFQCNKCFVFGAIFLLMIGGGFSLMGDCDTDPVKNEDTGVCYTTIQAAINDASEGDRITVKSGTYEEQLEINVSITLEGASQWSTRILDGSSPGVVTVTADDVTIKNLGVFWTGVYGSGYYHGIKIESDDCVVDNVIVGDCPRNVYIYGGTGNTISNSFISTVFQTHESVTIVGGSQNVVCGNLIISSADIIGHGVVLVATSQNEIIGNKIANHDYGIYLFSATNNDIYYNNFINNDTHAYAFLTSPTCNQWDDGGTYGGNYWGPCTDSDCDGFCDTAYVIVANCEVDNYPLPNPSTRGCQ